MKVDPEVLKAMLIRGVREHGQKRVAYEIGTAREVVSRWVNDHHEPSNVHRRVLFEALTRLGVTPVTPGRETEQP